IAHLHGRPLVRRCVEPRRGEEARPVDAVAPGARAHVDHRVARAGRARAKEAIARRDAEGEGVHEDVPVVARVEIDVAADGGHADAVAVVADPGDDALDEVGRAGMLEAPEAQCIEDRHRAGAHREHVAQDAAHAGCGPWDGSTAEGWLWLSILNTAARPSPMSTAPAFSPGPWSTAGPFVGSWRSSARELL